MTISEEMYILSQMLENWMNKRSLTYEMQQSNYINLTNEEIQEYYSALDIYEQIDALCDILVSIFKAPSSAYTSCWKNNIQLNIIGITLKTLPISYLY